MKQTRAAKYGKNLGVWIEHTISALPEEQQEEYASRFCQELRTYSFQPRKNGTPPNEGCVHELSDLAVIDLKNPEHFAKLVKEGIHLMYQKGTAGRVFTSLLGYLQKTH